MIVLATKKVVPWGMLATSSKIFPHKGSHLLSSIMLISMPRAVQIFKSSCFI